MPDWTAITGIIVFSVVGPSVAGSIAWSLAGRARNHERVLNDREEARATLDGASQALLRAHRLSGAVRAAFLSHGASIRAHAEKLLDDFYAASREADVYQ